MKKERSSNFELLRVICMVMIVAYHMLRNFDLSGVSTPKRLIWNGIGSWGVLGVNCFIMISAYFMINQKPKAERIVRVVVQTLTYSLAFLGISLFMTWRQGGMVWDSFIGLEIHGLREPFWSNRYWFVTAYLLLCLFMPVYNFAIQRMSEKQHKQLLVICSIIPVFGSFDTRSDSLVDFAVFSYIYLLTAYLKKKENNFFERHAVSGCIICMSLCTIINSVRWPWPQIGDWLGFTVANTNRHSAMMIVTAVFLFCSFKKLSIGSISWINGLAGLTLGIYLFHENKIFNMCGMVFLYLDEILPFEIGGLRYYGLTVITLFCLGTIVEWLRQKLLEKPLVYIVRKLPLWDKMAGIFSAESGN